MTYDPRERPLVALHATADLEREVVLAEDRARIFGRAEESARRAAKAAWEHAARLRAEIGRRLAEERT